MIAYISASLRKLVRQRAKGYCEYCHLHEADSFATFQIDHIISLRHGGLTILANLAFACIFCNRNKCSDIATILFPSNELVRLFNPRTDIWTAHFTWDDLLLQPISKIGEATIKLLEMNDIERILERQILQAAGKFPPMII